MVRYRRLAFSSEKSGTARHSCRKHGRRDRATAFLIRQRTGGAIHIIKTAEFRIERNKNV